MLLHSLTEGTEREGLQGPHGAAMPKGAAINPLQIPASPKVHPARLNQAKTDPEGDERKDKVNFMVS